MRNILLIIRKEFKQIFRNPAMLAIIFLMPILQLLLLSNAADFEIKMITLNWEDNDKSPLSQSLLQQFTGNGLFVLRGAGENRERNDLQIRDNTADMVLSVPPGFEHDLMKGRPVFIQLRVNAIDDMAAGIISSYAARILNSFYNSHLIRISPAANPIEARYLYNPPLNYKIFMVPGIIVVLITVIGLLLTALNIVREKEIGTIEQINVSPIKKHQFILGKLTPMLLIGIGEFLVCILIAMFLYQVPFVGSFFLELLFLFVYLVLMLGMGLLVSTQAQTQQQAMFIGFFILMVFIFLSGLFSAVENMPGWGQVLSAIIPVSYFIKATRAIMLKGAGFSNLYPDLIILVLYALVVNTLAILAYKKTSK